MNQLEVGLDFSGPACRPPVDALRCTGHDAKCNHQCVASVLYTFLQLLFFL